MTAFLVAHWPYVLAALGAVVVGVKACLSRWRIQRALEVQTARAERSTAERDQARGEIDVAETRAEVATDHAHHQEAARAAEEVIHAVPATGTPSDRVRALDAAARGLSTADDPDPVRGRR